MSDEPAELRLRHCVPCEGGTPPLDAADIAAFLPRVPDWKFKRGAAGADEIARAVSTPDFLTAVQLVNRLTPIAEAEGHHPDLEVGWGRVVIHLTTHAAEGLTPNDFILAARFDEILD